MLKSSRLLEDGNDFVVLNSGDLEKIEERFKVLRAIFVLNNVVHVENHPLNILFCVTYDVRRGLRDTECLSNSLK